MTEFSPVTGIDPSVAQRGWGVASHGSDAALFVEFHWQPVHMGFKSQTEGRPIYEKQIYCRIVCPGLPQRIVDRLATEEDKMRFPRQWEVFNSGNEKAAVGTPVEKCPLFDVDTVEMLKHLKIYSMEQLAALSDQQGQGLGPQWRTMKDQAAAYLKAATDSAVVTKQAAEIAELKARLEALENPKSKKAAA